jgi:hypothetical protein
MDSHRLTLARAAYAATASCSAKRWKNRPICVDLCKSVSRISVAAAGRRCVSSRLGVFATALKIPPQKLKDAKKLEGFTSS